MDSLTLYDAFGAFMGVAIVFFGLIAASTLIDINNWYT